MGNENNKKINYNSISYVNGDRYEGNILNNQRHGYGKYYYHNGDRYEGFWDSDQKNGHGMKFYKNGSLYIGQWNNNVKEGIGTLYLKNGEKYVGNFQKGKKNGKGILYSKDEYNKYIGYFTNDLKNGKGIMYFNNNKKIAKEIWKDGILISCQIIDYRNNRVNKKKLSKKLSLKKKYLSFNLYFNDNNTDNKELTINIGKYFKARIPNNFFDAMNIILLTNDLFYSNTKIYEWDENNIIYFLNRLGIEKDKYKKIFLNNHINIVKFLKLSTKELKYYEIEEGKDVKIILKSIDFLRILVKTFFNYVDIINENSFINNNNGDNNKNIDNKYNQETKIKKNDGYENNNNRNSFERNVNKHRTLLSYSFKQNHSITNLLKGKNNYISIKKNSSNNNIISLNNSFDIHNNKSNKENNYNNNSFNNININDSFNLELAESNIIKLSITKLLLNSLNLSGFNFYIPFEELKIIKKIGEGGFGEVHLGIWNFKKVAIKKFTIDYNKIKNKAKLLYKHKNNNLSLKTIILKFIKEINIISNLRHPNILLYIGASIDKNNNFYIVTEYISNGNLFNYLHKNNNEYEDNKSNYNKLNSKLKLKIAYQIALSIKYLHSRNITHCDIKSSNILLENDFDIKLSDFGLSQFLNILDFSVNKRGKFGTTHWMAPEIMLNQKYQKKSDVFSYGMILYELISGKIPYKELSNVQIIGLVADSKRIVDISDIENDFFLKKLCSQCIMYEIEKRPTFEEIINYFEKIFDYLNKKDTVLEDIENYI